MNIKKMLLTIPLLFIPILGHATAASVYVKEGNVFFEDKGKSSQITSSCRDENATLHPRGEWVYFVRKLYECGKDGKCSPLKGVDIKNGKDYFSVLKWKITRPFVIKIVKKIQSSLNFIVKFLYKQFGWKWLRGINFNWLNRDDDNLKQELWRVKTNGQDAAMLFLSKESNGVYQDYQLATIGNIQFSPSGDKVYFETPNWVTSAGLHVMNADGSGEKLLGGGNDTKIILSSSRNDNVKYNNYKGYIVTQQHRYWHFGGSYDWYYLFTPDFQEVNPLGDDPSYFTDMGELQYTDHSETKSSET